MAKPRRLRTLAPLLALFLLGAATSGLAADLGPGALPRGTTVGLAAIQRDRLEGHTTASGEPYNRNTLTAAHRSLALGTIVRVTNIQNHRVVIVRINDRASVAGNRAIQLTPRAGAAIGLQGISTAEVRIEVVGRSAARIFPPGATEEETPAVK